MAFLEYRPVDTLFQYCTPEGFAGILKSKRLWFTDLASANDPKEIRLGFEHFIEALKSVRENEYHGERGSFLSTLADHLTRYRGVAQAFCCSFSLAVDELPMWREYGDNYGGLAIGFRPSAVFDIPARIQKVRYLNENTTDDFRKLVLDLAAQFDATKNANDLNYWIPATASAFAALTALKHTSWAYEREVRLVHMQTLRKPDKRDGEIFLITGLLPDGQLVKWTEPMERLRGATSVKYLEFSVGRFRKGMSVPERAIERVIAGPKCRLSIAEVTDAMHQHGFQRFEVAQSICEIR